MENETENQEQEQTQEESDAELLEKGAEVAARMEAANAKAEELQKRREATEVRNALGGKADAGTGQVVEEEESDAKYAERAMAGEI